MTETTKIACTPDECAVIEELYQALATAQNNFAGALQGIGRVAMRRAGLTANQIVLAPDRNGFLVPVETDIAIPD